MPKTRPPYPEEFRQQIIELAQAGRTAAELSREFGPSDQTIHNWIAQAACDRGRPLPGKDRLTRPHARSWCGCAANAGNRKAPLIFAQFLSNQSGPPLRTRVPDSAD